MKKNLHPESQPVVFKDAMTGDAFLVQSTVSAGDTIVWTDGKTYPLVTVEISSGSHPVFTGEDREESVTPRAVAFKEKYAKTFVH